MNKTKLRKASLHSLQCIAAVCVISLGLAYARIGSVSAVYIFPLNFLVGACIVAVGIIVRAIPIYLIGKKHKGVDHTNYVERFFDERSVKRKKSNDIILFGFLNILFTALLQLALSFLV